MLHAESVAPTDGWEFIAGRPDGSGGPHGCVDALALAEGLAPAPHRAEMRGTDPETLTVWDVLRGDREVIRLERVVQGKPMAEAGVRSRDVLRIPNYRGPSEFIGALERSRGGAFAATVERNGKGISVVVQVPRHGR